MDRPGPQEAGEIAEILAELPMDHPARIAFDRQRSAVQIMYLLIGKPALLDRVRQAHIKGLERKSQIRNVTDSDEPDARNILRRRAYNNIHFP